MIERYGSRYDIFPFSSIFRRREIEDFDFKISDESSNFEILDLLWMDVFIEDGIEIEN